MARKGYTTVALPNALIEKVDEIVRDKSHGYISRPELIKEAVREKLRNIKVGYAADKKKE